MHWEHANLLWLLLVIPPALALFFWWRERSRQKLLAQFIEARLLSTLTVGISPQRRKIRFTLLVLASVFLIAALARPQHGFELEEIEQSGLDLVIAIDTSKSMLAQDIAPNRLARAKLAALELMQDAKFDRLGLVAFAGQAFLECPLTIDNTAFEESVQALDVNSISEGGTGLANAINAAASAFKENGRYKTLVLITDGEDNVNESAALDAAKNAAKDGLKIFTIGVGTTEGDLIRITDASGNSDYVRDPQGNVVKTHLDENVLRQIAGAAGGFYLPLRGGDTMDNLYNRGLAELPKTEGAGRMVRRYHEWFQLPLGIAIVLLLVEMFLPERARTKGNTPADMNATKSNEAPLIINSPSVTTIALIACFLLPLAAHGTPASALGDYNAGHYINALTEYSRLAEIQTNDFRLVFNAGDAAYRGTNFDLAQTLFLQVTLSPDVNLQQKAYYNLGNTQFQQAKQAQDLDGLQSGLEIAAQSYAHAVDLNTNDTDAAFNLNFTKDAVERIKEFRAMLSRAKNEADLDVKRAEFHDALAIMAPLQAQLQKTVAAKQFEDFTKKLKDIDDIKTPHRQ